MNTSTKTRANTSNTTASNTTASFGSQGHQAASAAGALVLTISMLVGIHLLATPNMDNQAMTAAASTSAAKS